MKYFFNYVYHFYQNFWRNWISLGKISGECKMKTREIGTGGKIRCNFT